MNSETAGVKDKIQKFNVPGDTPSEISRITTSEKSIRRRTSHLDSVIAVTTATQLTPETAPEIQSKIVNVGKSDPSSPLPPPPPHTHPLYRMTQTWAIPFIFLIFICLIVFIGCVSIYYNVTPYGHHVSNLQYTSFPTEEVSIARASQLDILSTLAIQFGKTLPQPFCNRRNIDVEGIFCVLGIYDSFWKNLYSFNNITWDPFKVLVMKNIRFNSSIENHMTPDLMRAMEPELIFIANVETGELLYSKGNLGEDGSEELTEVVVDSSFQCKPLIKGERWVKKYGYYSVNFDATLYDMRKSLWDFNSTIFGSVNLQHVMLEEKSSSLVLPHENYNTSHDGLIYWSLRSILHDNFWTWCY